MDQVPVHRLHQRHPWRLQLKMICAALLLPSLSNMRQSRQIRDQVDYRLRELQDSQSNGKFNLQRGGTKRLFGLRMRSPGPRIMYLGLIWKQDYLTISYQ